MSSSFLFVWFSVLLSACAFRQETEIVYGHKGPIDIKLEKGTPVFASLADPTCTLEKALPDMGKVKFWITGASDEEQVEFDFSGISGRGLPNPYSRGAYREYRLREDYFDCTEIGVESFHCNGSKVDIDQGELIPFCSQGPFPKDSIENVALVTMAATLQTGRFYDIVSDKKWSRSVDLLIHPRFERRALLGGGEMAISVDVDNARWVQRQAGEHSIEILPPSREREPIFKKVLALQLGVTGHEYSHHLFYQRAPELFDTPLESGAESAHGFPMAYFSLAKSVGKERKADLAMVVEAFNEGYADLMSHYAFSSGNFPFWTGIHVGYFTKVRLVKEERTGFKTEAKHIDHDVLRHFFRPYVKGPIDWDQPNHQDVHVIGSIYAHSLDAIFKEKLGASDQSPQSKNKAVLLNSWVDRIRSLYLSKKEEYVRDPRQFMKDSGFAAVKLAFQNEAASPGIMNKQVCAVVEAKFPAYVEDWKGRYACR